MGKKQMLPDGKQTKDTKISINANYATQYGFNVKEEFVFKAEKGLSETVIRQLSQLKTEPAWMLKFRLNAYKTFLEKPMPFIIISNLFKMLRELGMMSLIK